MKLGFLELPSDERRLYIEQAAIRRNVSPVIIEKWVIAGVHMKRGVIFEYCVRQNGNDVWLSKQEAIALGQEWRLHAILVHCPNGTMYLRPEYHGKRFREMVCAFALA